MTPRKDDRMAARRWFPHWISVSTTLAVALVAAGCQNTVLSSLGGDGKPSVSQPVAQPAPQPVKAAEPAPAPVALQARAALLVPLSGANAQIGQALRNAAELALFDMADTRFVLQPYDTQGTPEGARIAASLAVAQGANLVIGPLTSQEAQAATATVRAKGISMVSFSTDAQVAGNGVYAFGYLLREQAKAVVSHARASGATRFAAFAPQTSYGRLMSEAFADAVRAQGGMMTQTVFYAPSDSIESKAQALTQKAAPDATPGAGGALPFDVVLLPEAGPGLRDIASVLIRYGVDGKRVHLAGTMLWNEPNLSREPLLAGGWFPAPVPEGHAHFKNRYQETYGVIPADIAALGYDATAMAAVLVRLNPTQPFSTQALTGATGFAGVDGIFRFLPDGTSERGFAVMEIRPEGAVVVAPGPRSFPATTPVASPVAGSAPAVTN